MRGAGFWALAALIPLLVGLIAWGVVDGRESAKPWRVCRSPPKTTTAAEHLKACDDAIAGGHVSVISLPQAYEIRGGLLLEQKAYARAIADLDKALALKPDDAGRYNGACWGRAVAGLDLERARQACDRAIELGDAEVRYADAYDSRGLVGLKQGRFAVSYADYDTAVEAGPRNAHYLYGRGIAALRLGKREQGEADILNARKNLRDVTQQYESYGVRP